MTTKELIKYIKEKAVLSMDGDKFFYLIGSDQMEGICGFGDTEEEAFYNLILNLVNEVKKEKDFKKE